MRKQKRSFLRMGGLVLIIILALTALVTIASASVTAVPNQAPLNAPQAEIDNPAMCDDSTPGLLTCDLYATTGTITMPDDTIVTIWGYSDTLDDPAQLPGPTIIANAGDTVEVTLHNNLAETTSLAFPGQAMVPDLTGVAPTLSETYSFIATNPGTYLYEAGLLPGAQHQVPMGLYGALVVRPATANWAYDDVTTTFDDELLLLLSEIDPVLHQNPAAFDMRNYRPVYKLINGQAYPDTGEITAVAGSKVLLRYINAGLQQHSMGSLGLMQEVIAFDGNQLPFSYTVASETIGHGKTVDRMITIPNPLTGGERRYALYETSMQLFNNSAAGFGGMLTYLVAADGPVVIPGPTTTAVSLAPTPTDGSVDVTLSATIPGATSAEYFIGNTGGTGTAMVAGTSTDEWTAIIPAATVAGLGSGDHTFYVHGSDGTWGAFNFASLHLDRLGPATTGITLAPNPSYGNVPVALSATGNDSATGNSNIVAAEYFIGAPGVAGSTCTPDCNMTVNVAAPIASLDAAIDASGLAEGSHTVYVHSMDDFGWWGDYDTATLVVDQTGPQTSGVMAYPNPNNGSTPYSPTVFAVRVDATITDGPSTIQRAEGFINTVGADGSGFPLTPADGQFNETVEDAYVFIPLSTISTLGVGTHQIYVHGQDASGNWGATAFVDFVIETDIPTVSGVTVTPNTTDGTILVALTATASDPSSTVIDMAEWFAGADPGTDNGTSMSVTANGAVWDLAATIDATGWAPGVYQINVRARDAAGNWSPTAFANLTVTEAPPTAPGLLYFSTFGSGLVPGTASPYDDADVYLWNSTLFSREFNARGGGNNILANNADIDGLAYDANAGPVGGLYYMSFRRNQGTNVPGVGVVQDEDIVTYNPEDNEWQLYFAGADECDGMDATNGHDIDAFDIVDGVSYFSTIGNAAIAGVAGPYDDADIYKIDPVLGCTRVFRALDAGLDGSADIDGLTVVDDDTFYISFVLDTGTFVPGLGLVEDESVVLYDFGGATPLWSMHFNGTAQGLGDTDAQDLDAIDVQ